MYNVYSLRIIGAIVPFSLHLHAWLALETLFEEAKANGPN